MGVYIPNMERHENCFQCDNSTCDHWGEYGYDNSSEWENEKYKLIRMTQAVRINKEMAERRSE